MNLTEPTELHRKLPSLQINEGKQEPQDEDVKCSVEEIQRKRKKGNEKE